MKLVANSEVKDEITYHLNWLYRITSWPWRPWAKTESHKVVQFEKVGDILYCSPETMRMIRMGELPRPEGVTEIEDR